MKIFAVAAVAAVSCASGALAQSVEFRIVERFSDTTVFAGDGAPTGSAATAGDANDRTLWFVVQARVSGLDPNGFNGLGGFAGSVTMTSGAGNGSYKAAGTGGVGGTPTNNSPVIFYPVGTSDNGFSTTGVAHYEPYRLVSNLGPGGNGTRLTTTTGTLTNIVSATGGSSLDRLAEQELTAAAWGVDAWINVYTFQYDVTAFGWQTMTWTTNFNATYFNAREAGVPNSLPFASQTQGTYTITPAPAGAAVLALGGLLAARRRR